MDCLHQKCCFFMVLEFVGLLRLTARPFIVFKYPTEPVHLAQKYFTQNIQRFLSSTVTCGTFCVTFLVTYGTVLLNVAYLIIESRPSQTKNVAYVNFLAHLGPSETSYFFKIIHFGGYLLGNV